MLRALLAKFRKAPTPTVAFECNISDIERAGRKAVACIKCSGLRANVLRHADGRVSAVCAGCGGSSFLVVKS